MPEELLPATYQGLPVVSAGRMREVDRLATEQRGLKVIDLMERAGRAVAGEVAVFLASRGRELRGSRVAVCCGRGANGGDGLVAARILKEGGAEVQVFICAPRKEGQDATGRYPEPVQANLERAQAAGVAALPAELVLAAKDRAVDGLP